MSRFHRILAGLLGSFALATAVSTFMPKDTLATMDCVLRSWSDPNTSRCGNFSFGNLTIRGGTTLPAGDITTADILDGTVASADIAADTIVAADIATGGVATAEILDGTILTGDIATDTIVAGNIAAGAVATSEILDATILSADVSRVYGTGTAPTLSSCGTTPDIDGNDEVQVITLGTGDPAACTSTFAATFTNTPACNCNSNDIAFDCQVSAASATAITLAVTAAGDSSGKILYINCRGQDGG